MARDAKKKLRLTMGYARHDGLCRIILCAILDFGRRDVHWRITPCIWLAFFLQPRPTARSSTYVDHINLFLL